ncbi:Katanin p80 WD40 repeat-containing subunit B1 [Echinococcus granulosus]|uniref:Katanin p80 WD40 repeat-containing subunit B1 n=1 Tax=Echinococcus granulosus TaxID=6210 RepID=A0A068WLZ3_ECHGR|nr:Katanin p80 WD40 repeat-containing subunit B1 [Echinococcus granulosus]CDS19496.1 katanin p80 WD40 containing subunit B1 [Echinococcus granulosus]
MQRKAWKFQEFVAHVPGAVTTLALGRKSARVMATGGEDRRVKLWAVGKPTCIMSLSGHTSSVDAAQFSPDEDCVAAGSLSGSIRIWDLEEAKLARALSGHTASVQSLDFHPHGNFITSGSADSTVKLWDVSRKGCINTFRGHTGCVNMVRFSPDGNWVVSAGDDGHVKVWDLVAGKQLAELSCHTAPVTSIAYHPTVLLLASASADRTVRVFDLETFTQVSVSGIELAASAVRRIAFHPEGQCLYVATTEQLKIYHFETMSCLETVQVGWRGGGGVVDMAVAPSFNQLVGASLSASVVATYIADVKSCAPFTSPFHQLRSQPSSPSSPQNRRLGTQDVDSGGGGILTPISLPSADEPLRPAQQLARCKSDLRHTQSASIRKSFSFKGETIKPRVVPEESSTAAMDIPSDADDSRLVIDDVTAYNRVFKPKRAIARSPTRPMAGSSGTRAPPPPSQTNATVRPPQKPFRAPSSEGEDEDSGPFCPPPMLQSNIPVTDADTTVCAENDKLEISDFLPLNASGGKGSDINDPFANMWNMIGDGTIVPSKTPVPRTTAAAKETVNRGAGGGEMTTLHRLRTPHAALLAVLSARQKSLTTVRLLWPRENLCAALESAILMQDQAVFVDVLRVLLSYGKQWSLDLVAVLLPQLSKLIWSKYPTYVETTCQAVRLILKNFANLIRQTLNSAHGIGVDITHEERRAKCQTCVTHLEAIRSAFDSKDVAAKAGQYGREVSALFSLLE